MLGPLSSRPPIEAGSPSPAFAFASDDRINEVLRLAIQVANDVIPFDAHRVFLLTSVREEVWHFKRGFKSLHRDEELQRSLGFYLHEPQESPTYSTSSPQRHIHVRRLERPEQEQIRGYFALARRKAVTDSGGQPLAVGNEFSDVERYHLEMVVALSVAAFTEEKALDVLRRLHDHFLDGRMMIQDAPFDDIVGEYLKKCGDVLHLLESKSKPDTASIVRIAFHQVNSNGAALNLAGCHSTRPNEWNDERRERAHEIPTGESPRPLRPVEAFRTLRATYTNQHQRETPSAERVFPDTACLISAPVVAGQGAAIGTFTVGTTSANAYDDLTAAALALLAGHAYWPLHRAAYRETVLRYAEFFADDLMELRHETTEEKLLEALKNRLKKLGYARGLFSKVDYPSEMIHGFLHWGDKFEKVKECTHRHFRHDYDDCQVIAVTTGKPCHVDKPRTDARAKQDSFNCGDLKAFSIYPILDNHGDVIWTVHLERRDTARQNEEDEKLIKRLGALVMKAWEEERRTEFERFWFEQMYRQPFISLENMLETFAQHVVNEQRVRRCKVFRIDHVTGKQELVFTCGKPEPSNQQFVIDEPGHPILKAKVPVLYLAERGSTNLELGDDFQVVPNCPDRYAMEFKNTGRTQWVEIPICRAGQVEAKLVLDHLGSKEDKFSLGEMRMLGRLHRLLNVAAEVLAAQNAVAKLSTQGLHRLLIAHYSRNRLTHLRHSAIEERGDAIEEVIKTIDQLNAFSTQSSGWTLGDILKRVRQTCLYIVDSVGIGENKSAAEDIIAPEAEQFPQAVSNALSLYLVLVTMTENACKHIGPEHPDKTVTLAVELLPDEKCARVTVTDRGVGIDDAKLPSVHKMLESPVEHVAATVDRIGGLALSGLLAKHERWEIDLKSPCNPTVFCLKVAVT